VFNHVPTNTLVLVEVRKYQKLQNLARTDDDMINLP